MENKNKKGAGEEVREGRRSVASSSIIAGEVGMAIYCLWRGNHSSDIM